MSRASSTSKKFRSALAAFGLACAGIAATGNAAVLLSANFDADPQGWLSGRPPISIPHSR